MGKFMVSCENDQELADLTKIARLISHKGYEAGYFDVSALLGVGRTENLDFEVYSKRYNSFVFFKKRFKDRSPLMKLFLSIVNSLFLIFHYYRSGSRFILIGTPLLVYRLARILTFGRLKTVSLIRGVLVYSEEATSLSSKVFMRLGWLGRSRIFRAIFSDYYSSLVFCTGKVSGDFLVSRGVPENKIKIAGSVYCDSLGSGSKDDGEGRGTVVYVSSAFAFHGYPDAQKAQTDLMIKIHDHVCGMGGRFIIRKHPREDLSIYSSCDKLVGSLDVSNCSPVVGYPKGSLFISPTSTLIFEMAYAGRYSFIIADDYFKQRFALWYKGVGVDPVIDWESLVESYFSDDFDTKQDLTKVISTENKREVAGFCVREIFCFLGQADG